MTLQFDIFSGPVYGRPLWLEMTSDLDSAVTRTKQYARRKPGQYFVYNPTSRTVVVAVDSRVGKLLWSRP